MVRAGSQEAAASAVTQSIRPLHAGSQRGVAIPNGSLEGHGAAAWRGPQMMTAPVGEHQYGSAGVRRRDSTRALQVDWRCVHVQHSQRGLSTCLQATRDVEH